MSLNLGVMSAAVTLDDDDYRSKLSGLEGASESTFRKIASFAAGYLTLRGLFSFAQSGVQAFADLQTASWNFAQVFNQIPGKANEAEAEMRKLYKLSETTSKNMLSRAADQLQAFGFTAEKSLELARKASERGIDLASFKGGNQADAVDAIVSALTGQTERMKRYGVVIQQNSEKFREMVASIQEATGATELQARTQAVLQTIMEQTKNAEGDYLKEGSTIAQQQMDIAEATIRAKSAFGEYLSDGVSPLMSQWNNLLVGFANADPALQRLEIRTAAAAASFALLAKSGALAKANMAMTNIGNGLKSFTGGFSGVQAKAEADAVAAAENLKVASAAKTEAFMEARAQLESVRIAKRQSEEAAAALTSSKLELKRAVESKASADVISAAEAKVSVAKRNSIKADLELSNAQSAMTAKRNVAKTAAIACAAAENTDTAAKTLNAKASTLAGRANIVLANAFTAAKTAANGFAAALGPIGAAMIALSAVYMAYQYISEKNRKELEGQLTLSQDRVEAAKAEAEANSKAREEQASQLARLKELSRYERLNNSEKEEAKSIIASLTKTYGDLGVSIDSVTGKLKFSADAWKNLNEEQNKAARRDAMKELNASRDLVLAQQQALRDDLKSFWKSSVVAAGIASVGNLFGSDDTTDGDFSYRARNSERQQELDRIMQLRTEEEQVVAFEKMRNSLIADGESEKAEKLKEIIAGLKTQIDLQKQLDELGKQAKSGEKPIATEERKIRGEAERNAQLSLENREREIKFNKASVDEQIAMLDKQLDDVFSRQSGKYATIEDFKNADRAALSEQELKDMQEIVDLEEKRYQLRKQSADAFQQEDESYQRLLRQREKRREDDEIERKIKSEEKAGNQTGVDAIVQGQYEKARDAARQLQTEYEQAVKDAQADQILTEEEKKRIAELRSKMQEAMSDEDKWQKRILTERSDGKNGKEDVQKSVGAWSSKVLSSMLGSGSPEKETAKNTREMVRLQRQQLEKSEEYT